MEVKQLKKQCATLETALERQAELAQGLSQTLIEREQKNLQLEQRISQLIQELEQTTQALAKSVAVEKAIVLERKAVIRALTDAQARQVEQFRENLKALNEMNLAQVREMSTKSQDRWL